MEWKFVLICSFVVEGVVGEKWNYFTDVCQFSFKQVEEGPDAWPHKFAKCNLTNQSPINIDTLAAQPADKYEPLLFVDYDNAPDSWVLTNNGHTLRLDGNFAQWTPQIQGGGLPAKYHLAQAHFHWGDTDFRGSEHHLDGRQFPLEMHLVHVRRPISDYLRHRDENRPAETSLAVVGIFFQISPEDNSDLQPIVERLQSIRQADSKANFSSEDWTLENFLPNSKDFFRYSGSLTTPSCDEAVVWSVFPASKTISSAQLEQFRRLMTHDNHNLTSNYRPVQKLNTRKVTFYGNRVSQNRIAAPVSEKKWKRVETPKGDASRSSIAIWINLSVISLLGCAVCH